ncbi:hypothetical protein ABB37_02869 [Leptomonas pyrrhocoris]|uniref:Uncharacterized protein n=1 Tax=Leptomonas pyrrhocoris TaxID=157538 RepID=A0A0M9G664_LEPPY|nr:hypothetical protein ABB37_02869 [Leptomonas pyrrhocoris]XP_015661617.1 hypothetical protein ABB37_02869 [Leptomonas pyrrhocoris]KPA83177.1 hypothetical protein ABB37_02869 [Leptomonas pyrrhocoris]KPA83178.1 hypothetical protein ABB37_02869 [Leptomonas pyrrhocoris]|eukprot:XP_015661616.1 hypothetical protein ABB37_02869 [Leptomonas pyrrhocoris]
MRRWISLGGWCGPSLMLTKLGLRPAEEALPFDMARCTFDGLVELTTNGFTSSASSPVSSSSSPHTAHGSSPTTSAATYAFPRGVLDGFFPVPRPPHHAQVANNAATFTFTPDPVSVWLLFRSQHACFTHFDLNNPDVQHEFRRRMQVWDTLLSPHGSRHGEGAAPHRPVTFVRTAIAENPSDEIEMLPRFHSAVRRRTNGQLPFRTVLVVHDQAETTQPLCRFPQEASAHQSPCVVWNITRQAASSAADGEPSLLDQCHDGYQTILTTMCKEQKWRSLDASLPSYENYMKSRGKAFKPYTELSRVAGVPAIRGTCTGFGSTFSAALGRCVHCGCNDGHAVVADRFDTQRPWRDEDLDELLTNYALQRCDEVAAVEATALKQKRGAHETWRKLREMLSD